MDSGSDIQSGIEVDNLTKTFGKGDNCVTAIDDISFSIETGSVVGLLGPNGAGKTTTIKSILGLVIPDSGRVKINGVNVHNEPQSAHQQIDAMLEGARNNYWRLTVEENIRYFAGISGRDPDKSIDKYEHILKRFDLYDKRSEVVRKLSRGMKQKVSLTSVLTTDASILFIDEPTLGLDVSSSYTLRNELHRIIEDRDLTVLLSSHDMSVIESLCDRVIILYDGEITADEQVSELLAKPGQGYRIIVQNLPQNAKSILKSEFNSLTMRSLNKQTEIQVSADSDDIFRMMDIFCSYDAEICEITTNTADMENVFLQMTNQIGGK